MMTEGDGGQLTAQAERLYGVISEVDGWLSRRDIARALGQKQMNPYQLAAIDLLISQGRLEVDKRPRSGLIPYELRYKARAR